MIARPHAMACPPTMGWDPEFMQCRCPPGTYWSGTKLRCHHLPTGVHGLGENYTITLPVVGTQNIAIPTEQLTNDILGYVMADLKDRATKAAPLAIGLGLGLAAVIVVLRSRK